jgi:heme exporter protein C
MIKQIINSSNILNFSKRNIAYLIAVMMFFLISGTYYAIFASPADYQQGNYARIMYIHVPSAWLSLGIYSLIALCSFIYVVWNNPIFDIIAKCSAPIGTLFCALTLVSGSLWGKPTWGTWWVWMQGLHQC